MMIESSKPSHTSLLMLLAPCKAKELHAVQYEDDTLGARIAAHLESLIVQGKIKPGTRLPAERQLAIAFAVSRATLRDALSKLETDHLIVRTRGSGSTVLNPRTHAHMLASMLHDVDTELINAIELRQGVEPSIAALAAQRASTQHIVSIQEIINAKHDSGDPQLSMQDDIKFHLLLAHATGNPLMMTILRFTYLQTEHVRIRSHVTSVGRHMSWQGHQRVFDAIKRNDVHAARQAMQDHLREVYDVSCTEETK